MSDALPFDSAFILGAGALGSFLGARLSRVLPTTLVGRAPHVEAICREGLRLTGLLDETVALNAVTGLPDLPPRALVVVTVKLGGIPKAAEDIARRAREDTTVLLTQNGLEPDEHMREELKRRGRSRLKVVRTLTSCGCNLARPGEVEYWGGGLTFPGSAEVAPLVEILRRSGLEVAIERDFERAVWTKFAVNCVANPLSAILNVRNREVITPELAPLRRAILDEVRDAARDLGVELPVNLQETAEGALAASGNRNSMLQDIAYGRPTEIGELNGRVVEIARAHGREVPANATLSRLVGFLEMRGRAGRTGSC